MILGLADLYSGLEGGLIVYACPKIDDTGITLCLEVLHLLVDPLVSGNVCLEIIVLVLPHVLDGPKFIFKLSGLALGKSRTKKLESEFLVRGMEIAGFAKLINVGLS